MWVSESRARDVHVRLSTYFLVTEQTGEMKMNNILNSTYIVLALIGFVLTGCADLTAVRDFASLSASITGSTELSTRWRDTEKRLKAIPQPGDVPLNVPTGDRSKIHQDTETMLQVLTVYMESMGQLAADNLPAVDSQVEGLAKSLSALPGTPITPQRVEAVSILGKMLSLPLDAYRHQQVRKLIEKANTPLQDIVSGLVQLAQIYKSDLANEHKLVKDWIALQAAGTGTSPVDFLSRHYLADVNKKYEEVDKGIDAYIKALELIASQHDRLVNGLATGETISRTVQRLSVVRLQLIDARDKMRAALAQKM